MSDSPNPPLNQTPEPGPGSTLQRTGPILGGVLLGMGLTILPFALDRADLPSPVPNSLSWHQPERLSALELDGFRGHEYMALEVRLVEQSLTGDMDEGARERVLDYLARTAGDLEVRSWADEVPRLHAPRIAVEPMDWADELHMRSEPIEPVVPLDEPVAHGAVETAASEPGFSFLHALRTIKPASIRPAEADADPDTEVVAPVDAAPESTAAEPEPPTPPVEVPESQAVATVDVPAGPVEALSANSQVFVDLEAGDADAIPSAVTGRVGQLVQCYESSLEFDRDLSGSIEVEWHVRHGRVNALQVGDDTLGDEIALRCMTERIRRWRFEPDVTGMVAWRFAFETQPG